MCKRQPGLAMALVDDVGEFRHLTAKHSEGLLSLGQPASLVTRRLPATLKVVVPDPQLVAAGEKPGQLWLRGRNRSAPSSTCPTLTPTTATDGRARKGTGSPLPRRGHFRRPESPQRSTPCAACARRLRLAWVRGGLAQPVRCPPGSRPLSEECEEEDGRRGLQHGGHKSGNRARIGLVERSPGPRGVRRHHRYCGGHTGGVGTQHDSLEEVCDRVGAEHRNRGSKQSRWAVQLFQGHRGDGSDGAGDDRDGILHAARADRYRIDHSIGDSREPCTEQGRRSTLPVGGGEHLFRVMNGEGDRERQRNRQAEVARGPRSASRTRSAACLEAGHSSIPFRWQLDGARPPRTSRFRPLLRMMSRGTPWQSGTDLNYDLSPRGA